MVTVPEYTVPAARADVGVNVAILPEYPIVPATAVAPCFRVKLVALIVEAFIASLKVTLTLLPVATDVAFKAGVTDCTVGGVTSVTVAAAVVKFQV